MFVLQQVTIVVYSGQDYKDFSKKMTDFSSQHGHSLFSIQQSSSVPAFAPVLSLGSKTAPQPTYGMQRRTMSQTSAFVPPPVRQTSAPARSSGRHRQRGWNSLVIYFIIFNWLVFLC